jgi:membrane protein DedA with SNARE-associated domain
VVLLALLDSAGIPLPDGVDALLLVVAWKTPDRAYLTAALAVLGSLVGNLALFAAARSGGRRWVNATLEPGRPARFRQWFARYGLITVFIPALFPIPMPLKVFVISAGVLRTPWSHFIAVVTFARIIRFFGEAYIGIQLGENAGAFFRHNALAIGLTALAAALAIGVAVRFNGRRRDATIL